MKPNYIDSDGSMHVAECMNGTSRGRVKVVGVTLIIIIIWDTRVYLNAKQEVEIWKFYVTPRLLNHRCTPTEVRPFEGFLRR